MSEAVRVIVKCRPMNERELNLSCVNCIDIDSKMGSCSISSNRDKEAHAKLFTFDGAYGPDSTNQKIYADIVFPLVEGVTEGYNGTVFAYGQTGCGKTFCMQGIVTSSGERGIISQAFDQIFDTVTVAAENTKYLIRASYLEIYNEEIRDLLGADTKTRLELKERPDGGVYVKDLSMHPCSCVEECAAIMANGWKNRAIGSTLMNATSSRSHSIFTIHLERCDKVSEAGAESKSKSSGHIRASKLNLVDLAGSERQDKTQSTGDRFKEATKINLSLSALGNVISALVDPKAQHVPYRDSKLTRLLQDSLGGNTKTLMVACLSPADNNYEESLTTLRYANRAKNIKNKPKINEDPKNAMIREYLKEIQSLKLMLDERITSAPSQDSTLAVLQEGRYGDQIKSLFIELDIANTTKEEVSSEMKKIREEASLKETQLREQAEKLAEESRVLKEQCEQRVTRIFEELEKVKSNKEQVEYEMVMLQDRFDEQVKAVEHFIQPEEVEAEKSRLRMEFEREILAVKDELDSAKQMNVCSNTEMKKLQQSCLEAEEKVSTFISLEQMNIEKIELNLEHEKVIEKLRRELEDVQRCKDQTMAEIALKEQLHNEELKEYALKPEQVEAEKLMLKHEYEKNIRVLQSELDDLKISKSRASEEILEKNQEHDENLRLLEATADLASIDYKSEEIFGLEIDRELTPVDLFDAIVQNSLDAVGISKNLDKSDSDNSVSTRKKVSESMFSPEIETINRAMLADYEAYTEKKTSELNRIRSAKDNLAKKINRVKIEYQRAIAQTELSIILPERLAEEKIKVRSTFEVEMSRNRDKLAELKDARTMISKEADSRHLMITNYQTEVCHLRRLLNNETDDDNITKLNTAATQARINYEHGVNHSDLMLQIQNEQLLLDRMTSNYKLAVRQIDEDVKLRKMTEDVGNCIKSDLKRTTKNSIQFIRQRQTLLFERDDRLRRDVCTIGSKNESSATHCSEDDIEKFSLDLNSREPARRLRELQHFMIGGDEQSSEVNSIRAKLLSDKQYAENRRLTHERALMLANEHHEILHNLYTSSEEEIMEHSNAIHSLTLENELLKQEVHDLQCEFQYDRVDYLDTIREQDRTIKWYEAIVAKILPALRRDSNYVDLDRMKVQSEWDDLNRSWKVPEFKIEKPILPSATGRRSNSARCSHGTTYGTNYPRFRADQQRCSEVDEDMDYHLRSEDRFIQRLNDSSQTNPGQNYFRPRIRVYPDYGDGIVGSCSGGNVALPDARNRSGGTSRLATPNNYLT